MKRGLKNLMFLVVFGLIFVSLVGSVDADCPIGMVSYWKFDETAGDSADGNPGNLVNGPVWTTGQVNGALNFDGVNDYVDAGNGQSLNLSRQKITVSAWFLTKSFPVGGHPDYFDRIVNKDDGATDGQYSLGIRKLTAGDPPHLTFKTSSGGSSYNAGNSSTTQVVANTWYHVVGVNNGASNLIYVNGVLKHSIASGAIGGLGADSLYIGYNHPENPIYSYYFTGTIDEVAIFNRALSAAEISELYEKGLAGKDYCYSECSLGETSCSGANYLTCNGWSWTNNGKVDGFCENLCQPDDIIMKLYSPRNSHGALWDYSGEYDWHICYSDIFGSAYTGDLTTVHVCTGSNKVLGLYDISNAHAEIPSLDNYAVDVCYGNLVCEADTSAGDSCTNGGEVIVRLYQENNSHISNASDANYPIKICCKSGLPGLCGNGELNPGELCEIGDTIPCSEELDTNYDDVMASCKSDCSGWAGCTPEIPPNCGNNIREDLETCDGEDWWRDTCRKIGFGGGILSCNQEICQLDTSECIMVIGEVYWANMLDEPIDTADLGDTVKLIASIPGVEGKDITFGIWNINDLLGIDWLWPDSKVDSTTGIGFTKWITDTEDVFYFKVDVDGDGSFEYSSKGASFGELTVSGPEANSPPTAIIIYPNISLPRKQRRFKINKNIDFNQTSWDEDDDLEITWDFGDGNTKTCIKSQEDCDTTHAYNMWGTKDVDLIAKEIGRWQEDSDYTTVFIYNEGINVFAIITQPNRSNNIFAPEFIVVQFNASESYVANCTYGDCPSPLPPGVTGCYNPSPIEPLNNLSCYDLPKTGENGIGRTSPGQYNLWFNWTFSEIGNDGGKRFGNWLDNYDYVVEFKRPFFEPIKHWANLKVGYKAY